MTFDFQAEEEQKLKDRLELEDDSELGLEIADYGLKGRGIRATKPFKKGDFLVEYAGELIDDATAKLRDAQYDRDPGSFGMFFFGPFVKRCYSLALTFQKSCYSLALTFNKKRYSLARLQVCLFFFCKALMSITSKTTGSVGASTQQRTRVALADSSTTLRRIPTAKHGSAGSKGNQG